MERIDHDRSKLNARRAYERGRIRHAVAAALPILVLVGLSVAFQRASLRSVGSGALLYATATLFLWQGRARARGVLFGVAAGMLPCAGMLAARAFGHQCDGSMCCMICVPMSLVCGAVAGVAIGQHARCSEHVLAVWGSSAVIAALTGALVCASVGVGGLLGLVGGLVIGSLPLVVRPIVG